MKKAIELSLNFLVTVIIAVAILVLGVKFINDIAGEATELESLTTDQLDKKITELNCESTDRVCMGISKKTIPKGEFDVFGIKIINILENQEFNINVKAAKLIKNNEEITDTINLNKIKLKYRNNLFIGKNEEESIGVGVEVPKDTASGTYIFDVKVQPYDELYKIYVEVP
ncbi:MAG: hypothetical protein QF798_04230 [Candidatus Woesearchaeota archaeon]|jgi:hypothetical protein|nr:hypothetical protein [Candidatus Woesearchaeota archaeon]|tara:strand:- start:2561 stop:3073 length:513 start_codon:yes stop_codon:yes gene_type:complete